jgi:hypothetical protein
VYIKPKVMTPLAKRGDVEKRNRKRLQKNIMTPRQKPKVPPMLLLSESGQNEDCKPVFEALLLLLNILREKDTLEFTELDFSG